MIKSQADFIKLTDQYYSYLKSKSVSFTARGFPIFPPSVFLKRWPMLVVPFTQRHSRLVTSPRDTLLCFYGSDKSIYRRLERVFSDIAEYKKYMGAIMSDLTVTADMDPEYQDMLMLLNQLFTAVLAVNAIPVVFNTRCGGSSSLYNFSAVPKNIMCASGFLECHKKVTYSFQYTGKILSIRPSKLILYGKHDTVVEDQLNTVGQEFRVYADFHKLSKGAA